MHAIELIGFIAFIIFFIHSSLKMLREKKGEFDKENGSETGNVRSHNRTPERGASIEILKKKIKNTLPPINPSEIDSLKEVYEYNQKHVKRSSEKSRADKRSEREKEDPYSVTGQIGNEKEDPYSLSLRKRSHKASGILSRLDSKKDMVVMYEIFDKPKALKNTNADR